MALMEDLLPKIASINILITKEINMLKIFTSAALAVLMATAAYSMEDASSSLPVDGSTTVVTGGATGYSEPVAGEVAAQELHGKHLMNPELFQHI
jgi:hypothetical protein